MFESGAPVCADPIMRSGSRRRNRWLFAPLRAPLPFQPRLALPQLFALPGVVPGPHSCSYVLERVAQARAVGRVPGLVCAGRGGCTAAMGSRLWDGLGGRTRGRRAVRTDAAGVRLVGSRVGLTGSIGENRDVVDRAPINGDDSDRELRGNDLQVHAARLAPQRRGAARSSRRFGPKFRRRRRCARPGCAAGVRTRRCRRNR